MPAVADTVNTQCAALCGTARHAESAAALHASSSLTLTLHNMRQCPSQSSHQISNDLNSRHLCARSAVKWHSPRWCQVQVLCHRLCGWQEAKRSKEVCHPACHAASQCALAEDNSYWPTHTFMLHAYVDPNACNPMQVRERKHVQMLHARWPEPHSDPLPYSMPACGSSIGQLVKAQGHAHKDITQCIKVPTTQQHCSMCAPHYRALLVLVNPTTVHADPWLGRLPP